MFSTKNTAYTEIKYYSTTSPTPTTTPLSKTSTKTAISKIERRHLAYYMTYNSTRTINNTNKDNNPKS